MLTISQSAIMAGLKVIPVKALSDGSLDLEDLKSKASQHKDNLAAFMVSSCFLCLVFFDVVNKLFR